MPEQLTGVIERITFHNLDNGYCVLRVQARGHRDVVTVVGHCPQVVAGEYVTATGDWVTDRTHGLQFKAAELKTTAPHTPEGIAKYLGSGLVKGIGPKFAKRIVDVFGENTLEVIDKSPTFLSQVKGIGPKLIEKIRQSWEVQRESRKILVFLQSYGIGTAMAVRIYKEYGENAIDLIKKNPYRLSTDIWGIGFHTADQIALNLGVARDSPYRAQAAVRHVLQEATGDGHVGFPEELLREHAVEMTQIPPAGIIDAIEQLRITDEVVRDSVQAAGGGLASPPNPPTPFPAREGGFESPEEPSSPPSLAGKGDGGLGRVGVGSSESLIFLKPMFLSELGVARSVKQLAKGPHPLPAVDVDGAIAWAEKKMRIALAESQRAAIRAAVTHKLMVVTGGPGTGKTTIVRAIIEIFLAKSLNVVLCAPTGRAAKRLSESTGREATTIHRLLGFDPRGGFARGREEPLDADLVVVDETSMVDVVLMNRLLQAVPEYACVVFVGDVDQLPSVGAGSVLTDLIESKTVPVARLTEIHRQAGSSWIVRAAHAVNRGEVPESAPVGGDGDFYFVEANEPEAVVGIIRQMVTERIPKKFGLDPFRDVQVLTPQVKTLLGVQNLNRELQSALNPGHPPNPPHAGGRGVAPHAGGRGVAEVKRFDTAFRVGDKVMQMRNNYDREVFNGDIGRVVGIDIDDQTLAVEFDGREVPYDFNDLDELQLSYACSIHKCVAGYGRTSVASRGLVPVRDVRVGDQVQTGLGGARRVLDRVETGNKPIVRVRTRCGYTLDVSAEHPLLVATEQKRAHYQIAGNLVPGTFACIDRSVVAGQVVRLPEITYDQTQKLQKRVTPPTVLEEDVAWALGVIVGDGCCRDKRDGMVDVSNQDVELITAYRGVFERMGLSVTVRPTRNISRVYFCSVPLRRWLERLGLGYNLAADKTVPHIIFGADARCRGAFLRGLFDTDGSVGRCNIRFTTASPQMARDVQDLLLSLGIVAVRFSQGERHHKVAVSGTALPAFAERVGFTVPQKKQRLVERLARCGRGVGKTNIDSIPFGTGLVREVRALIPSGKGIKGRGLFAHRNVGDRFLVDALRGAFRPNYSHLRRAERALSKRGLPIPEGIQTTLRENYFYDPIVSVEQLPDETTMYDLEVEDHHSFVVNGFVCHNSQGSEYPAVVIPVHTQHFTMLQRNLIYTGITRGRKLVVLVGSRKAMWIAVNTAETKQRYTLLKWRLTAE
jgi:exodeoxyribonuclease V alpha subunit